MKLLVFLLSLTYYIATSNSSVYKNIKDDVLSYLKRSYDDKQPQYNFETNNDMDNEKNGANSNLFQKAMRLKNLFRKDYENTKLDKKAKVYATKYPDRDKYELDPVFNSLEGKKTFRRRYSSSSYASSSSSKEMSDWKDEWREHWIKKKIEVVNSSDHSMGDVVNMVAARPWGVPCGDPNQHDMLWGSCMLAMECEAEYRIYRGDYLCGRTQFVCCALQLASYDMYQGEDVSFADSGLSTDSEEKRNRGKGSKERRKRRKKRQKRRRKRDRLKRKRKIKKNIRKIIREIRKILNRVYRNGTTARKKKTKQLKKFIKELKRKYKKDRESVKVVHEMDLIKIDSALQKRLDQIKQTNKEFMNNGTFRDIIVNGTTNRQGARMLVQAYPDLAVYFGDKTRRNNARRTGETDHPDYDVEYGMLYY